MPHLLQQSSIQTAALGPISSLTCLAFPNTAAELLECLSCTLNSVGFRITLINEDSEKVRINPRSADDCRWFHRFGPLDGLFGLFYSKEKKTVATEGKKLIQSTDRAYHLSPGWVLEFGIRREKKKRKMENIPQPSSVWKNSSCWCVTASGWECRGSIRVGSPVSVLTTHLCSFASLLHPGCRCTTCSVGKIRKNVVISCSGWLTF